MEHLKNCNLVFFQNKRVEENSESINSFIKLLVKEIFSVVNTEEAFQILENQNIDLIIVENNSKDNDGIVFVEKIREKNHKIPIILISDSKEEELLFRAISLNLSGYILRPVDYNLLLDAFKKCENKIKSDEMGFLYLKNDIKYNKRLKELIIKNKTYGLNRKEVLFFEMLCENKEEVITKELLKKIVYEEKNMSNSAINNFILRIRKRFGKDLIYTIPNVGYKLKE